MSNIKFVYFNIETINGEALEGIMRNSPNYVSHISIKPGLFLVNFKGTARDFYTALESLVKENSILIYDIEKGSGSYWGYMNKTIWDWIKQNTKDE